MMTEKPARSARQSEAAARNAKIRQERRKKQEQRRKLTIGIGTIIAIAALVAFFVFVF